MARKSSKASATAVTAALPAWTPSVTLAARVGSSAIIAWAASTLAASPGARDARSSRPWATARIASMAAWFSASGSPDGVASVGTTGGGAIWATGPVATPGLTPMPLSVSAMGYPSLSRSLETRAASSSRAWAAPSPSAARTTSSPPRASRASTDRMLRASTGSPPALAIVTFTGCLAAAWTNMAAGRACRPTLEPTTTRRSGMTTSDLRHAGTIPALPCADSISVGPSRRAERFDHTRRLSRGGTVNRGIGLVHFGGHVPSQMLAEIAEQPEALRRTFAALLPQIGELEALAAGTRQVLFIARGSSDNAAVYGQYLCSARAGRLATLAAPSLATAYHATLDLRGVLAVAISQSGATEEIVTTLAWARACGARTVAITNVPGSPLADAADLTLLTQAGPEQAVPATKTYTTQLAAVAVLTTALSRASGGGPGPSGSAGGRAGLESEVEALERVPEAVAGMLELAPAVERLAERLVEVETLVVSGRGFAYSTAPEVALKLKETCYLTAVGLSYADLVHGPIAIVDAGTPALLVAAADGPMLPDMTALARRIAETGADVYGIGGDPAFAAACRAALAGPSLPEHLAPFALIVPGQLLAEALARATGIDPDAPRGLRKVTQTDS